MPIKIFADERDKNLDLGKLPFSEIIDWRYEEQRQKYDELLAEKYKIESYQILYFKGEEIIKDQWYCNEQFKIISDTESNIKGYVLSFKDLTVPVLFYKQRSGDDKPILTYARTDGFEIISDIDGKKIKLNSFDVLSLSWCEKIIGSAVGYEVKEKRGIFKGVPQEGYCYCLSMKGMLLFIENHFEMLKNSWQQQQAGNYLKVNIGDRLEWYENTKSQIKAEIQKYGGDDWEKIMLNIQKKWSAFGR
ncbi:MAG: hypothetical protein AAB397_01500 [Patescibacteria group bacterium]